VSHTRINQKATHTTMFARMDNMHNDPTIGYPLMAFCFVFGWINQMTRDEITFWLTLLSGVAALVSFGIRSYKDLVDLRNKKKQDDEADME
jgi:hypothetical protein